MIQRVYRNSPPDGGALANAPRDYVKVEFARRLQAAMVRKGWNQSELARRAQEHLPKGAPKGSRVGRDNVSQYIRGRVLPAPHTLAALAEALGVEPADLLPSRGVPQASTEHTPRSFSDTPDGNVWVRVNLAVSSTDALKIMEITQKYVEDQPIRSGSGRLKKDR